MNIFGKTIFWTKNKSHIFKGSIFDYLEFLVDVIQKRIFMKFLYGWSLAIRRIDDILSKIQVIIEVIYKILNF